MEDDKRKDEIVVILESTDGSKSIGVLKGKYTLSYLKLSPFVKFATLTKVARFVTDRDGDTIVIMDPFVDDTIYVNLNSIVNIAKTSVYLTSIYYAAREKREYIKAQESISEPMTNHYIH